MNPILDEIIDKYGEYIEMAGEKTPAFLIDILCKMVIKERELNEYYKKRLKNGCISPTN